MSFDRCRQREGDVDLFTVRPGTLELPYAQQEHRRGHFHGRTLIDRKLLPAREEDNPMVKKD